MHPSSPRGRWHSGLATTAVAASLLALPLEAADPPQFTNVERSAAGECLLHLSTTPGVAYRLELSGDLREWLPLATFGSSAGLQHTDAGAPYRGASFYRAIELSEPSPLTGDHLATEDGSVVIHPIQHATLVLGWKGRLISVDPVGGLAAFPNVPPADLILITHSHSDHFHAGTIEAVRGAQAKIVAPQAVYNTLPTALRALTQILGNGGTAEMLGLKIEAVPAYNLTTSHHAKGAGNGYVLTIGGKRIYFAGDTEDTPEMRALTAIDVAFLPVNQPYTMTVAKAAGAIRAFRPRVVYPYHYRNADGTYADLTNLKERVGRDLGIEVRLRKWY